MRVGCLHGVLGHKRTIIEQLLALGAPPSEDHIRSASLSSSLRIPSPSEEGTNDNEPNLLPPPVLLVAWRAHKGEVSGLEHSALPIPRINTVHTGTTDNSSSFAPRSSHASSKLPVRGSMSNSNGADDIFPQPPPPFMVASRLSQIELMSWAKSEGVGKIWTAKLVEFSSLHKTGHDNSSREHHSSTGKSGNQNQSHNHRVKHRRSSMHTGATFSPAGMGHDAKGKGLHDAEIVSREHFVTMKLKAEVSHDVKNDDHHHHRRHHHHHHPHRTFASIPSLACINGINESIRRNAC